MKITADFMLKMLGAMWAGRIASIVPSGKRILVNTWDRYSCPYGEPIITEFESEQEVEQVMTALRDEKHKLDKLKSRGAE